MISHKFLLFASLLFILGCSRNESASDTVSIDENTPMMVEGDHTHYHVHAAEIAHDHTHEQAESTAHTHEHLHHSDLSETPIDDPIATER